MRLRYRNKCTADKIRMLITIYPLINLLFAYCLGGDGLLTIYLAFSVIIISLYYIKSEKNRRTKFSSNSLWCLFFIFLLTCAHVFLKFSTFSQVLIFDFAIIYWIFYSKYEKSENFLQWVLNNERIILFIELLYIFVMILSVIYGDGISTEEWGTTTLKGPYSINHVLAYEIVCFSILNLVIWVKKDKKIFFILYIFCLAIDILTGVRSTIIVMIAVFLLAFYTKKMSNKLFILVLGITVVLYTALNTNLFVGVLEKTKNAVALGSISSSRGTIYISSLKALTTSKNPIYWIIGMGQDKLTIFNRDNIMMTIHAHNDFIDALVQYGILGLFTYCLSLFKVCRKSLKALLIIGFLAFSNGFYMYQSVVVATPLIVAYCETVNRNNEKILPFIKEKSIRKNK